MKTPTLLIIGMLVVLAGAGVAIYFSTRVKPTPGPTPPAPVGDY